MSRKDLIDQLILSIFSADPHGEAECGDNYVSITELGGGGKPGVSREGGRWCGKGAGTNIYFSEGTSVSVNIVTTDPSAVLPTVQIK